MKKALIAAALLTVAACERGPAFSACSLPYIPPALSVTVQDSVTGANVTPGATVVISNGAYTDSVVAGPVGVAVSVGGGAGTYTVTVRQSGYQSWTRAGVKVESDPAQCGARTLDLTARLQPAA